MFNVFVTKSEIERFGYSFNDVTLIKDDKEIATFLIEESVDIESAIYDCLEQQSFTYKIDNVIELSA